MSGEPKPPHEMGFPKGIGQPALRALAFAGITDLEKVTRFTEGELLALHGVGPKAVSIIKEALRAEGKALARE